MINFEMFENFNGVIWVQPDGPNTAVYPLLCSDSDGPDEPQGDVSIKSCRQGDGSFLPVNISQNTKSQVAFDVVAWKYKSRSWLQKQLERRYPFPMYFHHTFEGGRVDTFLNFDAGKSLELAYISSKTSANYAKGRADENESAEKAEETFTIAAIPSIEYYKLDSSSDADPDSEVEPARDIAMYCERHPDGPLGAILETYDQGAIVFDRTGAAVMDGIYSADKGLTWTPWTVDPFGISLDVCSVIRVEIDKDTIRTICLRGTADGGPADIAWSDDDGGTAWNLVAVNNDNASYGVHSGALFALDAKHIWCGLSDGHLSFSDDGGLTWTEQATPTALANEDIYYVHFVDESYGWIVGGDPAGNTAYMAHTKDGGITWTAPAAEPAVECCIWVAVRDSMHVWVGMDGGEVWYSNDWGEAWEQRTGFNFTKCGDGQFVKGSGLHMFICGVKTVGADIIPVVWRSVNGGMDWEEYAMDAVLAGAIEYQGMNAMQLMGPNQLIAVGELLTAPATAAVWHLHPTGITW